MSGLMEGKVVVVTGGAAGIGRATAVAFARQGASVVIADIDVTEGEKAVAAIRGNGGEAICVRADVTKPTDVQLMVANAVGHYGGLDYAFNNAGFVGSNAGIVDTTEEDWHRVSA
jgi:NAD(P)-dependent dehydrogenase (short-subunit alcohol dehydrogenase family)